MSSPDAETLSPEKVQQILRGAAEVFARDGYEGASMARIAAEAGVSKGTLYNYFDGKAALFAAFVRARCRAAMESIFEATEGALSGTLHGIGRRFIDRMLSPDGLIIFRMVVAEAGKFPELACIFYDAGPEMAQSHLAAWLDRHVSEGRLAIADTRFAAEQFFQLCQTRIAMRCRLQMPVEMDPRACDRVVGAAVEMFLSRYAPRDADRRETAA